MIRGITILRAVSVIPAILLGMMAFAFGPFQAEPWLFGPGLFVALTVTSLFCLWFALYGNSHSHRVLMALVLLAAITVGWLGTIIGMVVATIRWPTSNMAPILGLVQTGPICFALGACIAFATGMVVTYSKKNKKPNHGLESTGAPPTAGTPETHP